MAHAVQTPYAQAPAAFGQSQLLWDSQFPGLLSGCQAQIYLVTDFCFSGGFVNEMVGGRTAFIAASSQWHELSFNSSGGWLNPFPAGGFFSQCFWDALGSGKTFQESYHSAYSTVLRYQKPAGWMGPGATTTVDYRPGDQAVLFSGSSEAQFVGDLDKAQQTLMSHGWNPSAIARPPAGDFAAWTSTLSAYAGMSANQRLIVYMNDHGANTDVIKSRHVGSRYQYEADVSLYRNETDSQKNYGITEIYTRVLTRDGYSNWQDLAPYWTHEFVERSANLDGHVESGWWIRWHATDPSNPDQWLLPGHDYGFGFDHDSEEVQVAWLDRFYRTDDGSTDKFDWGYPGGAGFGTGHVVYEKSAIPDMDPRQWPGWANGGDGWILAPIPEPDPLTLICLGVLCVVAAHAHSAQYVRARKKQLLPVT